MEGQSYRADHLVLRIENLTGRDLAYRVETRVADERRCDTKGDAPHNAIVLRPNETIPDRVPLPLRRARRDPPDRGDGDPAAIGLLRLAPVSGLVLYSPRTSAGHVPIKGDLCPQIFSWHDIRDGADRGELGWRDVIDFYARHNCEEYVFFRSYRYRNLVGGAATGAPAGIAWGIAARNIS